MDDKKSFIEAINDLGSRIKAYFKDKNIEDEKNTKTIKDGLTYVQSAISDVRKAVETNNNKKLEAAIGHLTEVLKEKKLDVSVEGPVVKIPEPKVEVVKEAKEAKETNELLKKVLQSLLRKEADNSVYVQNRRPQEAIPVKLTDKTSKKFYDAIMMAVSSANSNSSGGGGGGDVNVTNFPSEYPLPAAQVATLTPPPAITGFATEAKQDDIITELEALFKAQSSTASLSNVTASASSVTLLSSNTSRKAATFYNDSDNVMYLKLGATASTSSFTIPIEIRGYYELPQPCYTGVIDAIWAGGAPTGACRITEIT